MKVIIELDTNKQEDKDILDRLLSVQTEDNKQGEDVELIRLNLPTRLVNFLNAGGINTHRELCETPIKELKELKGVGSKSLSYLEMVMEKPHAYYYEYLDSLTSKEKETKE